MCNLTLHVISFSPMETHGGVGILVIITVDVPETIVCVRKLVEVLVISGPDGSLRNFFQLEFGK